MRLALPTACLLLAACQGPPAPDAALCRDVISRLCLGPVCDVTTQQLRPGDACQDTLTARTGCGNDDFTFTTPTRDRFLECRQPLVRLSSSHLVPPGCENVAEMFSSCPDVVKFYGGSP